jgi:formylglycine-generating enzyme required for sulfatase activity
MIELPMAQNPPQVERRIFISYAHADADFAKRLVAELRKRGYKCWIDDEAIKGGARWAKAIAEGISNCSALIVIVTRRALQSDWVEKEILWAQQPQVEKPVIPVLLEDVTGEAGFINLVNLQWVACFDRDPVGALEKLLPALPGASRSLLRELELGYLAQLKQNELQFIDHYTPISGSAQSQRRARLPIACSLEPFAHDAPPQPFADAAKEIPRLLRMSRRAVLLGEPGGGKTTILWKLVDELAAAVWADPAAPLPLYIPLGFWTAAEQSLAEFIAAELEQQRPGLGAHLRTLLAEKRAALLLDGLNELPVGQRGDKYPKVKQFIEQQPELLAVVACRKEDYRELDLGFDRIVIKPLDALQIREFVGRYLEPERGEELFWKLAGDAARQQLGWFMQEFGDKLAEPERVFWVETQLPAGIQWGYEWRGENDNSRWRGWLELRETPSSLMLLARNPYMLWMLTRVYDKRGELPQNRGALFHEFVAELLERESEREAISATERTALLERLASVAYTMQSQPDEDGKARTVLPKAEVSVLLDERLLRLASSASLLDVGEQVRFTHQLLQEYFAAQFMDNERRAGRLQATALWPPGQWWQRTNWEEAAILLAGLYSDDCTPVVNWLADANPEVAAQCALRSGAAQLPETTRERLRARWIPRLTDLQRDPQPQARAAVGRALGLLGLDNRKGVGVVRDARGVALPDIDLVEIPGGEFQYGDESEYAAEPQRLTLPTFRISRYPVTYAQFQTFLDDPEGYADPRWLNGLKADEYGRQMDEQYFKFANHPRENVNWYQALAFCRWLSWRWGGGYDLKKVDEWAVRLPTEFEWEKAARGTDGRLYPYAGEFDAAKGNTNKTGIEQTSAVGIFPHGASPDGVQDMSGNVWEWCLSNYEKPALDVRKENLRTDKNRVLRGGSWLDVLFLARAVIRDFYAPGDRDYDLGFRVVVVRPPH